MSDSAKGPLAGYLFQFEKALLLLSSLENAYDYITIESVDDVAVHNEDSAVMFTIQSKHSIVSRGTAFEDTSYDLWRTIQIWIEKLELGIFNNSTIFICSTNKSISTTSLLYLISTDDYNNVELKIIELLNQQTAKLAKVVQTGKVGKTIQKIITLIEFALSKKDYLKQIFSNIKIEDNEQIKEKVITKLHLNSDKYTSTMKDNIFNSYYGWITYTCKAKWNQTQEAKFTKKSFDEQWAIINSNSAIVNNIFRTKQTLGTLDESEINKKRTELFVKQIEDIQRRQEAKERIISTAIHDFIYADIEVSYIVKKGDFTEQDFIEFLDKCQNTWQSKFDEIVIKEIEQYNDEDKNSLAIQIFDSIMGDVEIKFKDGFSFTTNNQYLRNGSFLKLSNHPNIGWCPDWINKYK